MNGVPTVLNEISWLEDEVSIYMWKYFMIMIIIIIVTVILQLTIGCALTSAHTLKFYNAFRNSWTCFLYLISKSYYCINSQNIFRCMFRLSSLTYSPKCESPSSPCLLLLISFYDGPVWLVWHFGGIFLSLFEVKMRILQPCLKQNSLKSTRKRESLRGAWNPFLINAVARSQ